MRAIRSNPDPLDDPPVPGLALREFAAPRLLTTDHRLAFRQFVLDALDISARAGARQVELNLGGVVEIDASGLGILLLAQKRARELGLRLRLVDVPRSVIALLDATRMGPLFDIIRSR